MKKDNSLEIIKEINPIVAQVQSISITVASDLPPAVDLLSRINKYADTLKKDRLSLTAPLEESLSLIRVKYTPTEKLLKEAVATLKAKMGSFQTEQLRIQRETEAKIVAKVESGYITTNTAIEKMSNIDSPDKKIDTDNGSISFRDKKSFEIIEISSIPFDYLLPNEIKIREAMKNNIKIKGVRYFTEQVIFNKR